MTAAPFEVRLIEGGFTWRIIGASGRPLVYPDQTYSTDAAAALAAKDARARFDAIARDVDGGCA